MLSTKDLMTSPLKPEGKEAADLEEALALLGGLKLRVKVLDPTKKADRGKFRTRAEL